MRQHQDDLCNCATAYECRDRLPALAAWMSDEVLKQVPIWHGTRFERGQEYFDLDNPERGPFVATGDEQPPTDRTYACRRDTTERAWAQLVTWRQPVSADEGRERAWEVQNLGVGRERSASGDAHPLPPE